MIDSYFLQTYEETKAWLDSMNIRNYTINDDLTVDVDVSLYNKNLTKIPVQFNKVCNFYCYHNQLISLKGSPTTVDYFDCSHNQLISLVAAPTTVNNFFCHDNPLEDITDLDSKILINSIKNYFKWSKQISTELYDDYFKHWINKDISIFDVLKDKVSKNTIRKYKLNKVLEITSIKDIVLKMKVQDADGNIGIIEDITDEHNIFVEYENNYTAFHCINKDCDQYDPIYYVD